MTEQPKNPIFFIEVIFSADTNDIYKMVTLALI
jgi:oligosaccharyltransferase complex subunit gamma